MIETPSSGSSESGIDRLKMDVVFFSNEFPRDDLQDLFRRLHRHSRHSAHPLLARFIAEATTAIREEVRKLPIELRQLIPPYETLLTWHEHEELQEGPLRGAVEGVLLTLAQLGTYIGYVERNARQFRHHTETSLAALGVGLLSAGAVALSSSASDLPEAGADAIRIAFRMGMHVFEKSSKLESPDLSQKAEPWAFAIHNVDPVAAEEELKSFDAKSEIAETGKIFVSAVSRTSVTISGPPSRLSIILTKSKLFRDATVISLPVFGGLCHAPHVYDNEDAETITAISLSTATAQTVIPLYSTNTGRPFASTTGKVLWHALIYELLTKTVRWENVAEGVKNAAKNALTTTVLHSLGNSLLINELLSELKAIESVVSTSTNSLLTWTEDEIQTSPRTTAQAKLAIVGMSCRLPGGASNTEELWKILEQGLDVSRRVPADRFDVDAHYDPTGKDLNKTSTQYGCFIDEPGLFDAPFFNVSPREAQTLDPQMRLALVTAYEALERSGFVANRTSSTQLERIGTFYAQAADDYREVNQGQEVGTYYIPGGCRAFLPGRINYFFKFAGPSYSIDTACSSGLATIEMACQALWSGTVDMAVAGGVNILTNPDVFAGLCQGYFLTKGHNACKTWDASADGYCRAEGIGSVVIKRLEDAEADNDNILGVVLSAGTNHSAQAVSITHPHAGHQAFLARQVLRQAGVDPQEVSYVEMHGTGTQAGDHEEMEGVLDVYAPLQKRRTKNQPLHIGSVKANLGHGESVAGTTALIKVLMMLQKNAIPRHIGIKTEINPRFPKDFDQRNLNIAMEQTPWLQIPGKKRMAAINNFGAAGGNTMMLLEDAPTRVIRKVDPRPVHVVAVSAKTKSALTKGIENLVTYTENYDAVNLADLSYTTTARKSHFGYRVAVAASDVPALQKQLALQVPKIAAMKPVDKASPSVAFAFTGQGASFKSMNFELYHEAPVFRQQIDQLDSLARLQGFPSFIPALDGSYDKDHSHAPVITQLALVCTEIALARYWMSLNVKPDVVIGHSLGEYAALHIAGVTTASDTISMVGRRAEMLQSKCTVGSHTMMAVRASLSHIQELAQNQPYTIACINGPTDIVLSGTQEQMDNLATVLGDGGLRCIKLDVAYAFHSEQMDPILEAFEAACKSGVVFHEPKMPVISPLLGKVIFDGKTLNANYMRRATREAVDFVSALDNAQSVGAVGDQTFWVEIGPHPVCTGFIKANIAAAKPRAVASFRRGDSNWSSMASALAVMHQAGVPISWDEYHHPFESSLQLLDLPTYAWDDKNYWISYKGDWTLTKGNTFYGEANPSTLSSLPAKSELSTSLVQHVLDIQIDGNAGRLSTQSDLMQPDFLEAAWGHKMNNHGVATLSIHADISFTIGEFFYRKFFPKAKDVKLDVANLAVTKGLIANKNTKVPQYIRVNAETPDIRSGIIHLTWYNVDSNGQVESEPFTTADVIVEDAAVWLSSWAPIAHLVHSRIEALEQMAAQGKASRLSRNLAYTLWAANLVDYAEKYRGMHSVVVNEFEGFADIQLTTKESGSFAVAPYFIDSVIHLAGFIMNCSDAMDARNFYCVTHGWSGLRFAEPLVAGARYRAYVKMIPTAEDPTAFRGDVYVMREDGVIVGQCAAIQFHKYPRILLSHFFSAQDQAPATVKAVATTKPSAPPKTISAAPQPSTAAVAPEPAPVTVVKETTTVIEAAPAAAPANTNANSTTSKALALIAEEASLDISELTDDAAFANLGVDSLLSLVISEKLRVELDVKVGGSLFLDYPTIGDLRTWMDEYYG